MVAVRGGQNQQTKHAGGEGPTQADAIAARRVTRRFVNGQEIGDVLRSVVGWCRADGQGWCKTVGELGVVV